MTFLHYKQSVLHFEQVDLQTVAEQYGTPAYVYSEQALKEHFSRIDQAFRRKDHLICYALKANSHPQIIRCFAELGAGADVVSVGELELALRAGISPQKIVFAGVGKREDELEAALEAGILGINVESVMELEVLEALSRKRGTKAPVSLRINPDIDIHGHPYITTGRHQDKFGIDRSLVPGLMESIARSDSLELVGLHAHIGSQIDKLAPYRELGKAMRELAATAGNAGHRLTYIDVGGGLGVRYQGILDPSPEAASEDTFALDVQQVAEALLASLADLPVTLIFEPGRALVAGAGLLLTKVVYIKRSGDRTFVIVDAGMTDLIRPALYNAYHEIVPVKLRPGKRQMADVVGPVCESGDFLGRNRMLPPIERGDVLAVLSAGAYGYVLASNYNARPKPAEILISGNRHRVIRKRQSLQELWEARESDQ